VGVSVDDHAAGATDPLAAVVLERDGFAALLGESLVDDVEHLQERHVGVDIGDLVAFEISRRLGGPLSPYVQHDLHLLVAPLSELHVLELQGFLVEHRFRADAGEFPGGHIGIVVIPPQGFSLRGLELLTEMPAT
jgi:hypothetical protein